MKKNMQALIIILCLCISISSASTYIFHEANTFQEYTVSVYASSTLMLAIVCYLIYIWKNQPICELIENVEKAIDESKLDFETEEIL